VTDPNEDHTGKPAAAHEGSEFETARTISPKDTGRRVPAGLTAQQLPDVPDYTIIDEIARGGMGVVYRARQHSLDRIVALKTVLAGRFASDSEIEHFRAEAKAAGQLNHPGIVPVFDFGEAQGVQYFSMPVVDGESLDNRVSRGPLDPDDAARIVMSAANTIQFAHDNGLIHRDIKPANILVDAQGEIRITDFGIAGRIDDTQSSGRQSHMTGTPEFMSPEQASSEPAGVSSDVYSLGTTLYCLLTGRPPFQSHQAVDTILAVLEREPVPPRRLNEHIPHDLELVCLKCLEKRPQQRYESAKALAEELNRFLTGEPVLVHPVGNIGTFVRWMRRQPQQAAVATGLVTCFTFMMGGSVYYNFELDKQRQVALAALDVAEQESSRASNLQRVTSSLLAELSSAEDGMVQALQYSSLGAVTAAAEALNDAQSFTERSTAIKAFDSARHKLPENAVAELAPVLHEFEELLRSNTTDDAEVAESSGRITEAARSLWQEATRDSESVAKHIRRSQYDECRSMLDSFLTDEQSGVEPDRDMLLRFIRGELAIVSEQDVFETSRQVAQSMAGNLIADAATVRDEMMQLHGLLGD